MKNKPDPSLLQTSLLSNEIKKAPKSRETILSLKKGQRRSRRIHLEKVKKIL
jgi:hypothetical protein